MSDLPPIKPVLILGAGINGCAVARELVLNRVPVILVDQADISTGATAKSSRLIHGGIRYLEYGDFGLVSESLAERERLLTLAPQFVRPLKLHIPVSRRWGGMTQAIVRFLRLSQRRWGRAVLKWLPSGSERGLLVVRIGLWLYDRMARSSLLPGHTIHAVGNADDPPVDDAKYHWLCTYYDAQMLFPERFVIALLHDANDAAKAEGGTFHVLPYHTASLNGRTVQIHSAIDNASSIEFEPSAIVNATGAWGDFTLKQLRIDSPQLLGGTKGSHFLTLHADLRRSLGDGGIYAEAADGRLIFILPFRDLVLVGTTDERFSGDPEQVVATESELQYLVEMVNEVFPQVRLSRNDVIVHYSGVRPLPFVPVGRTSAIPRGHWDHTEVRDGLPIHTLIGGKLTTCRTFAQEVTDALLAELGLERTAHTQDRALPGAADYPRKVAPWCKSVAAETGFTPGQVAAVFQLVGTQARDILAASESDHEFATLPETNLPIAFVDWVIQHEWVHTLSDLVEHRICLVFAPRLSLQTLETLADRMVHSERLAPELRGQAIQSCLERLRQHYGREIPR